MMPYARLQQGFSLVELMVVLAVIATLMALVHVGIAVARDQAEKTRCASNLRQLHMANVLYAAEHTYYVPAAADKVGPNRQRWHGAREPGALAFDGRQGPLVPYLGGDGTVRRCGRMTPDPTAANAFEASAGGYGYNDVGVGSRRYVESGRVAQERGVPPGLIRRPAQTVMFTDTAFPQPYNQPDHLIEYSFAQAYFHIWHNSDGSIQEYGPAMPSVHFRHRGLANVGWADGHVSAESLQTEYSAAFTSLGVGWFGGPDNTLFKPF